MPSAAASRGPFERIGIVGLGLIGGSVALGVRARWPRTTIVAVDRPEILAAALMQEIINDGRRDVASLTDCDLIVLAAPVPAIVDVIGAVGRAHLTGLVTDVGSTKRAVMQAARDAALPRFIGGHPMAGRERGGLDHASPDLFLDRPWFLVSAETAPAPTTRLERLITGLGAAPRPIDPTVHDRTMAYVSHLPQWVSVALMARAGEAVGDVGLAQAGRGFEDLTRLASSPWDMWAGIFATNADFIAEAAEQLAADLATSRAALEAGATPAERFAAARHWRDTLMRGRAN